MEPILDGLPGRGVRGAVHHQAPEGELLQVPEHAVERAAVADRILPWFGITPTAADREAMAMIAGQDAKTPDHRFDPAQAAAASAEVAAAAATLGKPYQRLLAAIV